MEQETNDVALVLEAEDFDFQLREPGQRDKHYSIDIVQDGASKRYRVKLDGSAAATADGRTLSDALHNLANLLEAWRTYGTDVYDPERISRELLRMCDNCGKPIFFARTQSNKWMCMDGEPYFTSAKERKLPAYERPRLYILVDNGRHPDVRSATNPQGYAWLCHSDICGAKHEPPTILTLLPRWEENRKTALDRQGRVADDLIHVIRDLEGNDYK